MKAFAFHSQIHVGSSLKCAHIVFHVQYIKPAQFHTLPNLTTARLMGIPDSKKLNQARLISLFHYTENVSCATLYLPFELGVSG